VTFGGVSLTGAQSGDYSLTIQSAASATITAKALNYTGISAANKTYNGNTTASLSGTAATLTAETAGSGSTSDGKPYTGDTVSFTTGTLTGTFASQTVANNIAVTVTSGVTLTAGGQSADYSVGSPSPALTANITQASSTTTASTASATYSVSGQNVTLNATVTSSAGTVNEGTVTFTVESGATVIGTATTSGTVSGGNASVSYALPAGQVVGTYTIQAVYNPAVNFATSSDSTHSLTINPGAASAYRISDAASGAPTAGVGDQLTITLVDQFGNTVTGFSGDKTLTFSGLSTADDGTLPTVTDKTGTAVNEGTSELITFASGVSSAGGILKAYKAETKTLNVTDSGSLSSTSTGGAGVSLTIANVAPVATDVAVTRTAGTRVAVLLTSLTNHWSDANHDLITLASVSATSTNSVTVTSNANFIIYPSTAPNVNDQISYTISDGHGGTGTGHVNITTTFFLTGQPGTLTSIVGSSVTVKFYGIANYTYITQRSTNMVSWVSISTNTVNSAGQPFTVTDTFSDLGSVPSSAYYRLEWQP
jgi:hypothetical protein